MGIRFEMSAPNNPSHAWAIRPSIRFHVAGETNSFILAAAATGRGDSYGWLTITSYSTHGNADYGGDKAYDFWIPRSDYDPFPPWDVRTSMPGTYQSYQPVVYPKHGQEYGSMIVSFLGARGDANSAYVEVRTDSDERQQCIPASNCTKIDRYVQGTYVDFTMFRYPTEAWGSWPGGECVES